MNHFHHVEVCALYGLFMKYTDIIKQEITKLTMNSLNTNDNHLNEQDFDPGFNKNDLEMQKQQ